MRVHGEGGGDGIQTLRSYGIMKMLCVGGGGENAQVCLYMCVHTCGHVCLGCLIAGACTERRVFVCAVMCVCMIVCVGSRGGRLLWKSELCLNLW